MTEESWRRLELDQDRAEERVTEVFAELMEEGIDSFLITGAMWMRGIVAPSTNVLNMEQNLILCNMLQQFIDDMKEVAAKFPN